MRKKTAIILLLLVNIATIPLHTEPQMHLTGKTIINGVATNTNIIITGDEALIFRTISGQTIINDLQINSINKGKIFTDIYFVSDASVTKDSRNVFYNGGRPDITYYELIEKDTIVLNYSNHDHFQVLFK